MKKIEAKQSKLLSQFNDVSHGFFTRKGGISEGVYSSLNCSPGSNDHIDNVRKNRQLAMAALELESATLYGLNQIHSTKVLHIKKGMSSDFKTGFRSGDAMVTNERNIALSVLTADCAPVLFASSNTPVVAAAHAGWQGAVNGMVKAVVDKMCQLGAKRESISVCIGPTIHQASYEVKEDFIKQLNDLSDFSTDAFLLKREGSFYFDLPNYLVKQCELSGIEMIENSDFNTYEREDDFFSFRRNTHTGEKDYGRQLSVISLKLTN